jgi:hypothetical protein
VRWEYLALSILSMLPFCVFAEQNRPSGELAVITGDRVNLRAAPSLSAKVIDQFQFGSWVTATNDIKNSEDYSWRRVAFSGCAPRGCGYEKTAGWVAEDYVALISGFTRVTRWKEQFFLIGGPDDNYAYYLHSDGTFDLRVAPYDGACAPIATRQGEYCEIKGVILRKDRIFLLRFNQVPSWAEVPFDKVLFTNEKTNQLCHHFYLPEEGGDDECASDI